MNESKERERLRRDAEWRGAFTHPKSESKDPEKVRLSQDEMYHRIQAERVWIINMLMHVGMIPGGLYVAYTAVKLMLTSEPTPGITDDPSGLMHLLIFLGGLLVTGVGGFLAISDAREWPKKLRESRKDE